MKSIVFNKKSSGSNKPSFLQTGVIFLVLSSPLILFAQDKPLSKQYVGFLPSVLLEPYDTINAVEINTLPFVYEFRWGDQNAKGIQLRPIANYRFFKNGSGLSHLGGTVLINWYILNVFEDNFALKPLLSSFYSYTYNRLDKVQTMTLGAEIGILIFFSNHFSITTSLQPGINYYPDPFSRDFIVTKSGFKLHFGIFFQIGYNF